MVKKNNLLKLNINVSIFFLVTCLSVSNIGLSKEKVSAYNNFNAYGIDLTSIDENEVEEENVEEEIAINPLIESYNEYSIETLNKDLQTYSGMALSNEYEDYIREKCNEIIESEMFGLEITGEELFEIMLTIGEKESGGSWNTDGVISATNDYGQFQINICNHNQIYNNLGITSEELLNDKYKNADAAIWLMCSAILSNSKCITLDDVFGMYNGWTNWRNIKRSVRYKDNCLQIMDNYFGNTDDFEKIKRLEKNVTIYTL